VERKLRIRPTAHDQPELWEGVTDQEVQSSGRAAAHQSVGPVQDDHDRDGMFEDVGRQPYEERVGNHLAKWRLARVTKGDPSPQDRLREVRPEHFGHVAGVVDGEPCDWPRNSSRVSPGRGEHSLPCAGWRAQQHQWLLLNAL
jgi:hypothetical protein